MNAKQNFYSTCILLIALLFGAVSFSQNLVPNPGFETITSCNLSGAGIKDLHAPPWNSPDYSSQDVYNVCSTNPNWSIPSNQFGHQLARSGKGYAGGVFYNGGFTDYREYAQVKLISPLEAGKRYCVSFYVSLSHPRYTASSKIGLLISQTQYTNSAALNTLNITPQIVENNIVKDTSGWHRVGGEYIATGGEQYIIIGSFSTTAATDTFHYPENLGDASYYYIDDVNISLKTSPNCETTPPPAASPDIRIITTRSTISFTVPTGFSEIRLFNAPGQLLYRSSINQTHTIRNFLPGGIYIVAFHGKGTREVRRFLIQH